LSLLLHSKTLTNQTHQRLDLAGAGHQFTASAFFVAGEMTEADFLDYLTKGVIIFGDRRGFDAGTLPKPEGT